MQRGINHLLFFWKNLFLCVRKWRLQMRGLHVGVNKAPEITVKTQ